MKIAKTNKFKVDIFFKDGKYLRVTSTQSANFEELSRKVSAAKFIMFSEQGVTINCSEIKYMEYAYHV